MDIKDIAKKYAKGTHENIEILEKSVDAVGTMETSVDKFLKALGYAPIPDDVGAASGDALEDIKNDLKALSSCILEK